MIQEIGTCPRQVSKERGDTTCQSSLKENTFLVPSLTARLILTVPERLLWDSIRRSTPVCCIVSVCNLQSLRGEVPHLPSPSQNQFMHPNVLAERWEKWILLGCANGWWNLRRRRLAYCKYGALLNLPLKPRLTRSWETCRSCFSSP